MNNTIWFIKAIVLALFLFAQLCSKVNKERTRKTVNQLQMRKIEGVLVFRLNMSVLLTREQATEENILRIVSMIGFVEDASIYVKERGKKVSLTVLSTWKKSCYFSDWKTTGKEGHIRIWFFICINNGWLNKKSIRKLAHVEDNKWNQLTSIDAIQQSVSGFTLMRTPHDYWKIFSTLFNKFQKEIVYSI